MAAESSGGRWPFTPDDQPVANRATLSNASTVSVELVRAAAEVLECDPVSLSPLNERVDSDWVDSLVSGETSSPGGVRAAVEVSFEDVSVLVRDDGRLVVYSRGLVPHRLQPEVSVDHDWSDADPLRWSIGRGVATAGDDDPAAINERLLERFDGDAIDRLLRPRSDGSDRSESRLLLSIDGYEVEIDPDGAIAVEPSLAVLKRAGAGLLVVGSIPEPGFERASANLLGEPAGGRHPIFVLHGRDRETANRRLSMAGISPSDGVVLEQRAGARRASAATAPTHGGSSTDDNPTIVPVSGGVAALPSKVREAIEDVAPDSPGDVRLSVDSLSSMIGSSDLPTTRDGIESMCRTIRGHRGIGHFILPAEPESDVVNSLAPSFDAIVALRAGDAGVEQRWRLTGTGHETPWFPLE